MKIPKHVIAMKKAKHANKMDERAMENKLPGDPRDWIDVSTPKEAILGHRAYQNLQTGEMRFT